MVEDMRKYKIKWQDDLKLYLPIYNNFIIEGYINDLCPVENKESASLSYKYVNISEALAKMFRDKYCVVFFDHTKKSIEKNDDKNGANEDVKKTSGNFGTFKFLEDTTENIALFNTYFSQDYKSRLDKEQSNRFKLPLARDMQRLYDAVYDSDYGELKIKKPFMFILTGVSRFMRKLGHPDEDEYPGFYILFEALKLSNISSKIIMLVDDTRDLPSWFESEATNHNTKKLYVGASDTEFRQTYYIHELSKLMGPVDYSILAQDIESLKFDSDYTAKKAEYDEKQKDFVDKIKKFTAFTDGFTVQDLQLFKKFIDCSTKRDEDESDEEHKKIVEEIRKRKNLENIEATVLTYKLGVQKNPWNEKSLLKKVDTLKSRIEESLKGQDKAIEKVCMGLKYAATGLGRIKGSDRRPRAVFFLAGPTGTGKTEIAKKIAEHIFGSEDSMIRFDMSEFSAEHTDSRLFGAPPGYVGYEAGGELTKAVKQKPFSLILFDEIEKANGRILDKFLQILGDGRLTDGRGETVYFTHTIIVFTSNCGITGLQPTTPVDVAKCQTILNELKNGATLFCDEKFSLMIDSATFTGIQAKEMDNTVFNLNCVECSRTVECQKRLKSLKSIKTITSNENKSPLYADLFYQFVEKTVRTAVKIHFEKKLNRPELLSRIGVDNIIVFNFITPKTVELIVNQTFTDFKKSLFDAKQIVLTITDEQDVRSAISKKLLTDFALLDLGAREIILKIESMLKEPIADHLISGCDSKDVCFVFNEEEGKFEILPRSG